MKRRNFITLLGYAPAAWPLAVRTHQGDRMRRIGVLLPASADDPRFQPRLGAFEQVLSLARPGGNTTGVSLPVSELDGKRQDLLMEAAPGARRMAMLADPNVATPQHLQALKDSVRARGVSPSTLVVAFAFSRTANAQAPTTVR